MSNLSLCPSLVETYLAKDEKSLKLIKEIILTLIGSLLIALSAKIAIPSYPIPFTMQTFMVLTISGLYGARLGSLTVLAYLIEGAIGLPFFAHSSFGLATLFGPTGGYLFGFLFAAFIAGISTNLGNDEKKLKSLAFFFIAHASIFIFGVLWLSSFIGIEKALLNGLYPFLIPAVLKFVLASLSVSALSKYKIKG